MPSSTHLARAGLAALRSVCASLCISVLPVQAQTASAATTPTAVAVEIDGLFAALLQSGCEFSRNGSWYSAKQASQHLQSKYDYLLKKKLVPNTEAFIERAASQSSVSSKPYLVRCQGQPEVQSKQWFSEQLQQLRTSK